MNLLIKMVKRGLLVGGVVGLACLLSVGQAIGQSGWQKIFDGRTMEG